MTASKTSACPSCGGPVLSDAKFCAACGTHLARTETLTPSAAVEAAAAPTPSARALPTITEMVAAAVPIVAIVVLGIVAPSVFTSPDAFFVYAFVQACVFLVVIRFFDLYEREPLSRIALMALWGATGAGFLALLGNGVISAILDEDLELAFGAAISASPVEEIAKGIALIAAFQLSRWANRRFGILESEGVTDGIVYGAAVGMGFALAEDIFYFFKFANESVATGLDVFLTRVASSAGRCSDTRSSLPRSEPVSVSQRGVEVASGGTAGPRSDSWSPCCSTQSGTALILSSFCRATVGIQPSRFGAVSKGVRATARESPLARNPASSIPTRPRHAVTRVIFYVALVAFAVAVALWLRHQRSIIRFELAEEVNAGLITRPEWELTPRYWRRTRWYWELLREGKLEQWRLVRRIHNELADLAFLKWRVRRNRGNPAEVERRRHGIANLRAHLATAV
jgi:protease PrsW